MSDDNTTTFGLTEWERSQLIRHASSTALEYMGHYYNTGLFRSEVETMNNWRRLSDKLAEREQEVDLPYRGTRRNGFDPNGKD